MKANAQQILAMAPVVPVIVINDINDAVPMAIALRDGGIPVLEVTLRTKAGLEAIRVISNEVDGVVVGAGTVTNTQQLDDVLAVDSEFVITPGLTPKLLDAGVACGVPFLPGIATVGELMTCLEKGLETLKFFPAEVNGGVPALKSIGGPFPDVRFCPTGGIGPHNLASYLALDTVLSVGGSWLTPDKMVANKDWAGITRLAIEAAELANSLAD